MQERLTFAIPYYRGKQLLAQAVESALAQRNPHWEMVICDDSRDNEGIGDLVAGYGDRRIRYCKNPQNLGLAENWNRCLREARTELVTILHADDLLLENYADVMLQAARDYPAAAAYFCNARTIDHRGRKVFGLVEIVKRAIRPRCDDVLTLQGRGGLTALLHGNFIVCPTVCYRRGRLGALRFNARWHFMTDFDLYASLLLGGETLLGVPATAYAYRRHGDSATAWQTRTLRRFVEETRFYGRMAEATQSRGWEDAAGVARKKRIIWLHLVYRALQDVLGLRGWDAARKLALLQRLA